LNNIVPIWRKAEHFSGLAPLYDRKAAYRRFPFWFFGCFVRCVRAMLDMLLGDLTSG